MTARLLALTLAASAAGCAGDGDDRLSRAQWTKETNAICLETLRDVEALGQPTTSDDFLRVGPKANAIGRRSIAKLRKLEPPEELEPQVDRMLRDYRRIVELQEKLVAGFRAHRGGVEQGMDDVRALANEATEVARRADRLATRLGVDACARDPWQPDSAT